MKLKPYAEIIKLSAEKLDAALAPIRAIKAKRQAELEMAKIDEQIATLESEVNEACASKDIDFARLIEKLDKTALLERRKKQYSEIITQLFPQ